MGKHLDKLGTLEDYEAPWEKKGEEFDPEKAKGLFYSRLHMEAEAKDKVDEVTKAKDDEIAALKAQIDDKAREGESDAEKATRERDRAIKKAQDEAKAEAGIEVTKLRVALRKGLNETQAKRLVGTTEEEIEKDADDLLESFGGRGDAGEGEGENGPSTRPVRPLRNPADPKGNDPVFDPEKAADAYVGSGLFI
jgi:membrane protein involved in colicin uptake